MAQSQATKSAESPERESSLTKPPTPYSLDLLEAHGNPQDARDSKSVSRAADATSAPQAERLRVADASRGENPAVTASADRLLGDAASKMNEHQRAEFQQEMKGFISQAELKNVSPQEITRTLDATAKLLEGQGANPLDDTKRAWLALSLMHNVGHADRIDQGAHNTCNVTAISKVLMTEDPAKVAEMVSSTALNGYYQAPDGKRISIDAKSLRPDEEAAGGETKDDKRNYATQVFDVVSINNYWQRQHPPFSYVQREPLNASDTGERLLNAWGKETRDENGKVLDHPNLDCRAMQEIGREVGIKETFLIANAKTAEPAGAVIDSPEELATRIKGMLAEGHPAMLFVEAGNKLFTGKFDGNAGEGWHVVTVDSYDPSTGKFHMSNQWGAVNDQNVSLADLYDATLPPQLWANSKGYYNPEVFQAHQQQMLDGGWKLEPNQVVPSKQVDSWLDTQKQQMRTEMMGELDVLRHRLEDARAANDQAEVARLQGWIDQTISGLQ